MNIEHIEKVKNILTKWNPLKEKSSLIEDLNDYETEATDIIFNLKQNYSEEQISNVIALVLHQAFNISTLKKECESVAAKIKLIISDG
ncbi:DUF1871 family protein [Maribacter sp. IgM3_T14_3]|uniref:DUF1871 family protein n=1 Tax=Maribacter sp. IgM3_T14_3 TaxID=3415140 RepID=UPI003C6FDF44